MDAFFTKPNMVTLVDTLTRFLEATYGPQAHAVLEEVNAKRAIYNAMMEIRSSPNAASADLRTLNNATLQRVQGQFHQRLAGPKHPVAGAQPRPEATTTNRRSELMQDANALYDSMVAVRRDADPARPTPMQQQSAIEAVRVGAQSQDDFFKSLEALEKTRQATLDAAAAQLPMPAQTALHAPPSQPSGVVAMAPMAMAPPSASQQYQQPALRSHDSAEQCRFIVVDAHDRDVVAYPSRSKYSVLLPSPTPRNVTQLQAARVIVPIADAQGSPDGLPFPYLVLTIDEIPGSVCDGTNDALRRAFCTLVFERTYRASSGRKYVVLQPTQAEFKRFDPNPISSLSRLSFTLSRPDGSAFDAGNDDAGVSAIAADSQRTTVALSKYVRVPDDVAVGDLVCFRSFALAGTDGASRRAESFVNRPEGHVITSVTANPDGFANAFEVAPPGAVDRSVGSFSADAEVATALSGGAGVANGGRVVNRSLQTTITLTAKTLIGDAAQLFDARLV
jgi:hypothetical protein